MAQNKKNESVLLIINLITQFFVETFVGLAIGYFGGKYLDQWLFGDKDLFVYILSLLGLLSGLVNLIRRVMKNIDGGDQHEKEDEHH
ncbi:MAG: AtpZ/AtpI family protein [Bacilli bacterium]|nr:AtpZ/AtpI family protein [Bacilli bacterium]MBN2876650.1 AtpZ/AtpI family protein [Bacilli bacterium]